MRCSRLPLTMDLVLVLICLGRCSAVLLFTSNIPSFSKRPPIEFPYERNTAGTMLRFPSKTSTMRWLADKNNKYSSPLHDVTMLRSLSPETSEAISLTMVTGTPQHFPDKLRLYRPYSVC